MDSPLFSFIVYFQILFNAFFSLERIPVNFGFFLHKEVKKAKSMYDLYINKIRFDFETISFTFL